MYFASVHRLLAPITYHVFSSWFTANEKWTLNLHYNLFFFLCKLWCKRQKFSLWAPYQCLEKEGEMCYRSRTNTQCVPKVKLPIVAQVYQFSCIHFSGREVMSRITLLNRRSRWTGWHHCAEVTARDPAL